MNILFISDLYFLLPDDFKGTRADALRLLAEYDEKTPDRDHIPPAKKGQSRWDRLMDRMPDGVRVIGRLNVQRLDEGDDKWEVIG